MEAIFGRQKAQDRGRRRRRGRRSRRRGGGGWKWFDSNAITATFLILTFLHVSTDDDPIVKLRAPSPLQWQLFIIIQLLFTLPPCLNVARGLDPPVAN